MADNLDTTTAPEITRRNALRVIARSSAVAALPALSAMPAMAATVEENPDAELLRLGTHFDEAYAAWVPLCMEW